jgi:DNA gyrase/topoisomerase IV subunit A
MNAITGQAHYKYELKKLISEDIERRKETLIASARLEGFDFAAYRHQVGIIEGLRMALDLCDETESVINGADRRG